MEKLKEMLKVEVIKRLIPDPDGRKDHWVDPVTDDVYKVPAGLLAEMEVQASIDEAVAPEPVIREVPNVVELPEVPALAAEVPEAVPTLAPRKPSATRKPRT